MQVFIFGFDERASYHPLYVCGGDTVHLGRLVHSWYREPIEFEVPECATAILLVPYDSLDVTDTGERPNRYTSDFTPGPNPFTTDVSFEASEYDMIHVYDVAGRYLFSWPVAPGKNLLDTGEFASGVYFFKLQRTGSVKKLVKVE